jgi:hypothetical protein
MPLDKPKKEQWTVGDLLTFNADTIDPEIIATFKEHIGEPPYTVHALDIKGKHIDGLIISGSQPVVIPPELSDPNKLVAFFNMSKKQLDAYVASGKPMIEGLLSLPTMMFTRHEQQSAFKIGAHVGLNRDALSAKDLKLLRDSLGAVDMVVVRGIIGKGPKKGWLIVTGDTNYHIPTEKPLDYYFTITPQHLQRLIRKGYDYPTGVSALPPDAVYKPQ